jgi:hypothetical protein
MLWLTISSETETVQAGHGVAGGDEERTSPEPEMARLATTSPGEARKET